MIASGSADLLAHLLSARSTAQVEAILATLPVVPPDEYQWVYADDRSSSWQDGKLHWLPVGLDRGNGGRIKLAGEPMNPLAERLVNGMESLIELARLRELNNDSIEHLDDDERNAMRAKVDDVRKNLSITLDYEEKSRQFSVTIRDHGMGQVPQMMHKTLLSLGRSDKADKPYLIGVF